MVENLFGNIYNQKRVLVTGHSGFKGSWLSFWLKNMGAEVHGLSLSPSTEPNHHDLVNHDIKSNFCDIRNYEDVNEVIKQVRPEIIFHLAAQPLVRYSYHYPIETYSTNVMGTANLLNAARQVSELRAIVSVTTDKCYENKEWDRAYNEDDTLGGFDPYSNSKACAELVTQSFRDSFFNLAEYGKSHNTLIATARAGNVIGGGDWSEDRLIPDIIKATIKNEHVFIRNPHSTRPWQHVLESLSGYLLLGQKLFEGHKDFARAFNFGPDQSKTLTVSEVAAIAKENWKEIGIQLNTAPPAGVHEAKLLQLDSTLAINTLKWKPIWDESLSIKNTISWYKKFYLSSDFSTDSQLQEYVESAVEQNVVWTK